mmetsp:Transcript_7969/g.18663  ORF Transcript_7969/g.18663 Transcript_7969/m.18663 type:complete len:268 (+) Transcript_7969:246-1049(+)
MHSRRVGDLKEERLASLYLGLTNSGITPPRSRSTSTYAAKLTTSWLQLPGYGDQPVSSASSPRPRVSRSNPSSWEYSTLATTWRPSECVRRRMEPDWSPARRRTETELRTSSCATLTPTAAGRPQKTSALVSWKKTRWRTPLSSSCAAAPDVCRSACTSPCPCGLVRRRYGSRGSSASAAAPSLRHGTFCCLRMSTCSGCRPHRPCSSRSRLVRSSVSSDVITTSSGRDGSGASDSPRTRALMCRMYISRYEARVSSSGGKLTLMPE